MVRVACGGQVLLTASVFTRQRSRVLRRQRPAFQLAARMWILRRSYSLRPALVPSAWLRQIQVRQSRVPRTTTHHHGVSRPSRLLGRIMVLVVLILAARLPRITWLRVVHSFWVRSLRRATGAVGSCAGLRIRSVASLPRIQAMAISIPLRSFSRCITQMSGCLELDVLRTDRLRHPSPCGMPAGFVLLTCPRQARTQLEVFGLITRMLPQRLLFHPKYVSLRVLVWWLRGLPQTPGRTNSWPM